MTLICKYFRTCSILFYLQIMTKDKIYDTYWYIDDSTWGCTQDCDRPMGQSESTTENLGRVNVTGLVTMLCW